MITFDDFKKMDILTARVTAVREHPNADKLLVLEVDTGGETKQLVAGIRSSYVKDQLIGKDIVIINNLEPAIIRGVESKGMLLAAQGENGIRIIIPDKPVNPGSKVR